MEVAGTAAQVVVVVEGKAVVAVVEAEEMAAPAAVDPKASVRGFLSFNNVDGYEVRFYLYFVKRQLLLEK